MPKLLNFLRLGRARMDHDLDRELHDHVEHLVDELRRKGFDEVEARRRAQIQFGAVSKIREEVRDEWTWPRLESFVADVRYAIRSLVRAWGFSLGTVAVLALGIGATVSIFSVVNTVLLQPLDYPNADRIVSVETFWTNTGRASQDVSGPDFLDWQRRNTTLDKMASYYGNEDGVTIVNGRAVFANSHYVSRDFFAVFGQSPAAGRLLLDDDIPSGTGDPTVVVVAHQWARTHFGSVAAALGKRITVYGKPMEIVGVAPSGFRYPANADFWAPWRTESGGTDRNNHNYHVVGTLKPGVHLARAQHDIRTIGDQLARQFPESRFKTGAVTSLQDRLTGDVKVMLWVLMCAVFAVLLIACANISNLLLARAAGRAREIALRAALGAGRGRLVRQLLTESVVLGVFAGAIGVLLAFFLVRGVVLLSPVDLPRLDQVRIDGIALLFALGLSLLSTVLFGLVPAIHAARLDLSSALKQGGAKGAASDGGPRPRAVLVVAEVALSVMLLASAGLLVTSFQKLQRVELGFTTEKVLVAYTEYAVDTEADMRRRSAFYAEVLDRLRTVPGVVAASGAAYLPMGREPRSGRDYFIKGQPEGRAGERPQLEYYAVTPDYFTTLQIPLRDGRDFGSTDVWDRPGVAIVNETLARKSFPGQSAVGQFIRTNASAPWLEIVGVVGDVRWQDPKQPPVAMLYASSLQGAGKSLSILARTSVDERSIAGTLRSILSTGNPGVPVRFERMDELFAEAVAHPRFRTQLIGAFAGVAALLAAVGIFSVLSYLVGQRTREIAIRRAVGATTPAVVQLIFGQSMRLVAIGLVVGLAGSLAIARLLQGLLYEFSPWNLGAYGGALVVVGAAALFATLIPAIRATTVSPRVALQQE
ncbi:MAG: ABC transporter permease [Gemmatimonadales bacterium]|nr:ABC transporter permease [Gemmatimonadales bacterium]